MAFSGEQLERYSRHFVLKEIGVAGQKKLLNSSVLVIGAGALGSAALLYLAAAGVGTLGISDYDSVNLSNLQRQILHNTETIGMSKTQSAKQTIERLNPDVHVILHEEKMTADNITDTIQKYDFIIDATDRFESKFLINDACVLAEKPYVHAGIVRFGGQVLTYIPHKGPCLRCLLENVPPDTLTCAEAGVLGAAVGVLGSIEALEAIKYIVDTGELLVGRLLNFDGLEMKFRTIPFPKAVPYCRVCGKKADILNLKDNRDEYIERCTL